MRLPPTILLGDIHSRIRFIAVSLGLAIVYVAAARVGLALDAVAGFASLVWPPTGIALAAMLLLGRAHWPGIALGALVANLWTGASVPVALGIATGNTLEALAGAWALSRVPGFRTELDRIVDVLALLALAATASSAISATFGVTSLLLGGVIAGSQLVETWRAWWVGDFMGDLLVAPVILIWASRPHVRLTPARWAEAGALVVAVAVASAVSFLRPTEVVPGIVIPVLIWAALRFGVRGSVSASFAMAVIAVWGTSRGLGPFVRPALRDSLLALQIFLGIVASTFLVLAASISERRRAMLDAQRARSAADDANRAKADFLAVMSHELRTPLNAISGYTDLLATGVHGPVTDQQRDALERIRRNQSHLLTLIQDVLTFAKLEAGKLAVQNKPVDMARCIDAAEPAVMHDLTRKSHTYTRDVAADGLVALGDYEKVCQILINLLSNAVKYTDAGGRITLGAERRGDRVLVWVRDSGIGIPADQQVRVFEPFFQADRGPTRRYAGIGLGLAISRDLARAMNGDLRLESAEGAGTTVTLDLPAARLAP